MPNVLTQSEVQVGPQGRVVIPATLRKALGIGVGDALVVRLEGNRLVLEKREAILERLRAQFAQIPSDISLTDELIADRREEAKREEREG
ncbi:MAG: AbrB/MazE/SpoVT family DNA-binding domain-containing protein [Deinococcota bacterium]|nr:AbrB/MazE/SpoVT family DNA-binding domain-containing protein [Deinococcota bacterium]